MKTSKCPLEGDLLEAIRWYQFHYDKLPQAYVRYRDLVPLVALLRAGVKGLALLDDDPAKRALPVPVSRSLSASLSRTVKRMAREEGMASGRSKYTLKLRLTRGKQVAALRVIPPEREEPEPLPDFVVRGLVGSFSDNLKLLASRCHTPGVRASILGVSISTVRNWETGRTRPANPMRVIRHIRDYMNRGFIPGDQRG